MKGSIIKGCEQVEIVSKLAVLNKFHVNAKVDDLLPICAKGVSSYLFTLYLHPNHELIHSLITDWKPEIVQWAVFGYRGYFNLSVKTNFVSLLRNVRSHDLTSLGIACGIACVAGLAVGGGWCPDDDVRICLGYNPNSKLSLPKSRAPKRYSNGPDDDLLPGCTLPIVL